MRCFLSCLGHILLVRIVEDQGRSRLNVVDGGAALGIYLEHDLGPLAIQAELPIFEFHLGLEVAFAHADALLEARVQLGELLLRVLACRHQLLKLHFLLFLIHSMNALIVFSVRIGTDFLAGRLVSRCSATAEQLHLIQLFLGHLVL